MTDVFYEVTEDFSAEQMFDLVNDIDAYPKFVPDCIGAGVLKRQNDLILAYIEVEKLGFKKRFSTCNKLNPPHSIEMGLVDGPFKKLLGKWTFTPITESKCIISFHISFEFKNRLLDLTFTPVFKELMSNMVNAFSERAKRVYQQK